MIKRICDICTADISADEMIAQLTYPKLIGLAPGQDPHTLHSFAVGMGADPSNCFQYRGDVWETRKADVCVGCAGRILSVSEGHKKALREGLLP